MAKAKMWQIGTRIESWVDEFIEWMDSHSLEKGSHFSITYDAKAKKVTFIFDEDNNFEVLNKTKASGMIRTLIMLNFVHPEGIEYFDDEISLLNQVRYSINSDKSNWRENFISLLSTYSYLEEQDEEGCDVIKFTYKKQKDAIFSILTSFEIYDDEDINEYNKESQKAFSYWIIKELFNDFDNELRELSGNIIHPLTSKVKIRKDINNIEWEELKIQNLDEVKDKRIESSLWNLSDILSSSSNISIPIMQRKYVWDETLVEKLLEDILSIKARVNNHKPFHYIGSIVYKEKNDQFRILDGQQRLTTMFLIITALYSFFISEDAKEEDIKVPSFFKKIFPSAKDANQNWALHRRFIHVHGNEDFTEFTHILSQVKTPKKISQGNMSKNFAFAQEFIKRAFMDSNDKQQTLYDIFYNVVERVAFTVNKNQIESEYDIFEKLNTLSTPLNQIDLMKNHILPYCMDSEIDRNEQAIQTSFHNHIFSKFEKKKNISGPAVKRFVNYFIQLYDQEYLEKEDIKLSPFNKLSLIIERKFGLTKESKTFKDFEQLLIMIGDEINSFLSITDRSHYINKENQYFPFSDILSSFDQRYVYAPLIKLIFDLFEIDSNETNTKSERDKINKARKVLFEVERYELFFQVVLYRGQSITGLIDKVSKEVKKIFSYSGDITPVQMRAILSDKEIMSSNLVMPEIETFSKKVSEDPIADKVSVLILNRMRFMNSNNNNIELTTSFSNFYHAKPTREHIVSQTIDNDKLRKEIFEASSSIVKLENYSESEFNRIHKAMIDMIGNIIIVESSANSKLKNKSPIDKNKVYLKLPYLENDPAFVGIEKNTKQNQLSLKKYLKIEQLGFDGISQRSKAISEYLTKIYQ